MITEDGTGGVETRLSIAADEYPPMSPARVRFSVRSMMIGIAGGTVLVFLGIRIAYAGLFLAICLCQEREELNFMEVARARAEVAPAPFALHQWEVAEFHARSAAYHAKRKWRYVRAMLEFWARIPDSSPTPPDLRYPKVPCVPPPEPLVPSAGSRKG
jgi:hypothetical protein